MSPLFILPLCIFAALSSIIILHSLSPHTSTVFAQPLYSAAPLNELNNYSPAYPLLSNDINDNSINNNNGDINTLCNSDRCFQSSFHWSYPQPPFRDRDSEDWKEDGRSTLPEPVHPPILVDPFQTDLTNDDHHLIDEYMNNNNNLYSSVENNANNVYSTNHHNDAINEWNTLHSDNLVNALLANDPSSFSDTLYQSPFRDRRRRHRPRRDKDSDRRRRPRRPIPAEGKLLIGIPRSSSSSTIQSARESCQRSCSERVISIEGRGVTSIPSDWIEVKMAIEKRILINRERDRREERDGTKEGDDRREKLTNNNSQANRMKLSLQSMISTRLLSIFRYLLSHPSSIIPRSFIRITSLRMEPEYVSGGPGRSTEFRGYRSAYGLTVRIKVDDAMKIITQLLRLGITRVDGISYISDPTTISIARRSALKRAVDDAFEQVDQFTNRAAIHLLISKWDVNQTEMEKDLIPKNKTMYTDNDDSNGEEQKLLHLFRYKLPYQILSATINKLTDPPARPLQVNILAANNQDQDNDSDVRVDNENDPNDSNDSNGNGALSFESLLLLQQLLNDDQRHQRTVSLLQGDLREIGAAVTIRIRF